MNFVLEALTHPHRSRSIVKIDVEVAGKVRTPGAEADRPHEESFEEFVKRTPHCCGQVRHIVTSFGNELTRYSRWWRRKRVQGPGARGAPVENRHGEHHFLVRKAFQERHLWQMHTELGRTLGHAWRNLSEGWRELVERGSSALTHFIPRRNHGGSREGRLPAFPRWSLLAGEVIERDRKLIVQVELPGISREDCDIRVQGRMLSIRGEKRMDKEHVGSDYYIMERAYGSFERIIPRARGGRSGLGPGVASRRRAARGARHALPGRPAADGALTRGQALKTAARDPS
jgi:HSP20 family protein